MHPSFFMLYYIVIKIDEPASKTNQTKHIILKMKLISFTMNQREHHKQGQTKKEKNINNKNSKINVDVFCIIHVG